MDGGILLNTSALHSEFTQTNTNHEHIIAKAIDLNTENHSEYEQSKQYSSSIGKNEHQIQGYTSQDTSSFLFSSSIENSIHTTHTLQHTNVDSKTENIKTILENEKDSVLRSLRSPIAPTFPSDRISNGPRNENDAIGSQFIPRPPPVSLSNELNSHSFYPDSIDSFNYQVDHLQDGQGEHLSQTQQNNYDSNQNFTNSISNTYMHPKDGVEEIDTKEFKHI
jgi:hypothetical protein